MEIVPACQEVDKLVRESLVIYVSVMYTISNDKILL